ncbi:hypothetical protein ACHAWX_000657, partial [Stephanocyclus meneghinianus]
MTLLGFVFDVDLQSWHSDKQECEWYGVSCEDGTIHQLDLGKGVLPGNSTGILPPEIN